MRAVALIVASTLPASTATATPAELGGEVTFQEMNLFDALPGLATQAIALLSRSAPTRRAAPACLSVDLIRQPAPMANHIALVTVWRGAVDRDQQVSSKAARSCRIAFQNIAASPIDERLYREITR